VATNAIAGVELGDPDLAAATSAGLKQVEDLLHREVTSGYQFVTETSLHLIDAGGKRFRPLFTLLGAQMGPRPESDEVITLRFCQARRPFPPRIPPSLHPGGRQWHSRRTVCFP